MSANLGTAWIQVKPSTQGLQKNILTGLRGSGAAASNQVGSEIRKSKGISAGMAVAWGAAVAVGYKAIGTLVSGFKNFVKSASEIQGLRASFQSLTGSVGKTNKVMQTLYDFGKKTAFSNEEIQSAGRSFLAVGQNAEDMRESLKLAGDIAGATGANLTQLVLPLTQAFSRGKLQTQDFYQILNSGAGALRGTIVEAYKASGGVKELSEAMSDGEITTDILWDAMRRATDQGGFAFNGAIKQAETFNGRMSNLQEAITQVGLKILGVDAVTGEVELGGPFDKLSNAIKSATEILGGFDINKIGEAFKKLDAGALGTTLGTKMQEAFGKIGEFIAKIDWPTLGMAVGKQSVGFIIGFLTGLLNFDVGPILKFAMENWWQILLGIATVIFLPAKLFGPLVKGISKIPLIGPMTTWIMNAIRGAGQFLFPKMTGFFNGLFGGIGGVLMRVVTFIKNIFMGIFRILIAPFRLFDTAVTAIFNLFKGFIVRIFSSIVNVIRAIFSPIVNFFAARFASIRSVIGAAWNSIKAGASAVWGAIRAFFAPVANFIGGIFGRVRSAVGSVFGSIRGGASATWGAIRGAFGGVSGFIRGVFQSAYNAVKGVWSGIGGFFSGIKNKIAGAFTGMVQIGRDIVAGIARGISPTGVVNKMKELASNALSSVKSFLGIKSPSRVMRDQVGKMMGLGMAQGITGSTKEAVRAAQRQSGEVLGAFSNSTGRNSTLSAQFAQSGSGAAGGVGGQNFTIINPNPEQTAQIVAQKMKMQGGF